MNLIYAPVVDIASLPNPADLFELRSTRMALAELSLLALAGGLLGAFVVLRRIAFFAHAAGTATFPGSVLAQAASFSPRAAALGVALGYAGGVERAGRSGRDPGDAATALLLVAALAGGVILASDVFESGSSVDRLLFGTAIGLDGADLAFSAAAAALAAVGVALLGRTWTAIAFDPDGAASLGIASQRAEVALLALVAFAVVAALPAVGALLVTSIFVVPAAIALLFAGSVGHLAAIATAVAAVQGAAGLYLSLWLDVPPGPAVAVLGAGADGVAALWSARR
jgi:manganese/iron transport system permease protein